jgi:uncharacterized protein (TIGR02757 family)
LRSRISRTEVESFLNQATQVFHRPEFIGSDPLSRVRLYSGLLDQEIVSFLSSMLAYGNVRQIHRSLDTVLKSISRSPFKTPSVWAAALARGKRSAENVIPASWKHRFNDREDLLVLMRWLGFLQLQYGSMGVFFVHHCMKRGDPNIASGLDAWSENLRSFALRFSVSPGFSFFVSSPRLGSACKRHCMFLRWMGRKDEIDPGLWVGIDPKKFSPQKLVIPLDTHLQKIARQLGLTRRKTVSWKMALEVTDALKTFDANDPLRYDFALCRLGIMRRI